ncbi:hypothetical protein Pfo_021230 [Paulownia fortunei]|nr:hypothetical protein Pfo_021230 [Paulownia fortunei]
MNDRDRELYNKRDYDERRWDSGINDRGCELYCEGDDDERWDNGSNDGVLLRLENRQPGFVEDDLSLGRFSGRLGRRVSKGEFIRSKKKRRLLKKNALQRIQLGKDCSRHSGGYRCQHSTKESSSGSFRGKEKEGFEWLQTRMEDKREREESPVELAISFKSNALVAKAILAPSRPAVKSNVNSTYVNNRIVHYSMSDLPSAKSSEDVVKTDLLTLGLDLRSDSQGTSKKLLDKAVVSGCGSVTANDANDLGEIAVKNEPLKDMNLHAPTIVGFGRTRAKRLRKKRRSGKQLLRETNLQMKKDSRDIINANNCINSLSAVPKFSSDTTLSKRNISAAFIGVVPDTVLLPSLGGMVSEKGDSNGGSYKPFVPNLKRKRSSLTTLSASSYVADNVITGCSGHAERLVTTTEDADHVCHLKTDEVARHAHETILANESTGQGDSLGFNRHANNVDKFVHNRASILDTEMSSIESIDRHTRLGTDRVDDISEHPFQDGLMLLENSFVKRPAKVTVSIEGHDIAGSSRPQESRIPEVQEDKYFSEIHVSNSSSESDSAFLQKPENVIISDVGSADANSKEFFLNQVKIPQVGVDAEEFRSLEGAAVADCSNVSLGISTGSDFLSADHEGIIAQFDVSFPDALSKKSFINDIDSVEGSLEAISNVKNCLSIDYSSHIIRKRKARGAQTGFSGSKTNVAVGTVRSIGGEVARLLAKDLVPAVEVDFLAEKDSSKEDDRSNEGPSAVEDSALEVDKGANGSYHGCRKKRKVASPRSNLSSLLEDDMVANGITSDCSELDQGSTRLAEWGTEQREDTPYASAAISKCGTADVEGKVGSQNFYFGDLDENMADGNKLHMNDDLAFVANNLSLCADRNGVCASSSDNELLASGSDMRSCMSSPEELLSYSDSSFSRNTMASACQSENEMICGRDNISNGKPVSADPNTFPSWKSLEKAASDNSLTNAELPHSLPENNSKVVKKLNLVQGKLTLSKNQLTSAIPKVFPGHHPLNFSNSRKFHSTHVTKSRTWHRTGNSSVGVTEPKLQPSPLLQSRGTKTARTIQSSYIRKGNSLVRNPSLSGVIPPGFHGSSCSVYRLAPCTDNLKNNQASDSKTGDADAPSLLRIEQVNTSGTHKALPLNHSGKSLNCTGCNLGESLPVGNPPRNDSPYKTLDALEECIKSSVVPECRTDSVNNSDSQSTLEEGNSEKKITYVKRRSNQLVAASNSDDTSILVVDKSQASLSDGYYKSRKNQLVRASSENHIKKGDVNLNSRRLVSRIILPRTCTRRQSGFAKSYRYSKFSFVWKLHDTQSSEKRKNSVGPQKVWPHLFPWKRGTHWRSFKHALGTKPNNSSFSTASQKLLLSRKRGAIYTRSTHGYSLRMSKVLSVGGSSLKWSKSIERNSKKANEEATRAVAAAEKRKKEEKGVVPIASKSRNHVSRERIFRIGSERYKMDPTRRTLHRITAEKEPSSSAVLQSEKNVKRSYVPRRLLIGNEEYVRIGNGNQLVRDPKKRTRVLASEKVRWSLRTARLRMARKRKYCQFFTRFGKCNKDDGKCPYIHDPSKIVVCTKFLNGSCSNLDCKLTHKVIPERMEDCSYFLKGSCSNENCPYRHVNVNPDSTVCKSFLRGYCADGNECRKKHTYVCPAFEATGICPQASTCKLHHPKKKIEKKPTSEQKIVRGRYFDGGLIGVADCSMVATTEKLSAKGKDNIVFHEGTFPDYISLDVSDEEVDHTLGSKEVCDDILPDAHIAELGELI